MDQEPELVLVFNGLMPNGVQFASVFHGNHTFEKGSCWWVNLGMTVLSKLRGIDSKASAAVRDSKELAGRLRRWSPLWKSNCSRSPAKIVRRKRVRGFERRRSTPPGTQYRPRSIMPNLTKTLLCVPAAKRRRCLFRIRIWTLRSLPTWHLLPATYLSPDGFKIVPRAPYLCKGRSVAQHRDGPDQIKPPLRTVIHFVDVRSCASCPTKEDHRPPSKRVRPGPVFATKPGERL